MPKLTCFNPAEERALLSIDCVLNIPRSTPDGTARRYVAKLKELAKKIMGLSAEVRGLSPRVQKMTLAEVRAAFAQCSPAPLEELRRWRKSSYSVDVQNSLRLAEVTRQLRFSQGAVADPEQKLRSKDDDAFDFDGDDEWDKKEHERCAEFHRAVARKASTMQRGADHFAAADLHDKAALNSSKQFPYDNSRAARAASRKLTLADVS